MWLTLKIFKQEMKYVSLICLYGYSLTCFIPVLIICASGFAWIQWILLLYGIANSSAFVAINLWNFIKPLDERKKYTYGKDEYIKGVINKAIEEAGKN